MSADAEAVEEGAAAETEEQTDPDDGRPPIDEEEMADLDAVREEVAEESAPPADEEAEQDGDGETPDDETTEDDPRLSDEKDTVGDFYVDTLVSTSNMLIEEHGREGADPIDGQPLRQMGVDDAVDELMASGDGPDMPPEQQVLLGTSMFGLFVLASKTTVIDDALDNADLTLLD